MDSRRKRRKISREAWAVVYEGYELDPERDIYSTRRAAKALSWDLANGGKKEIKKVRIEEI